MKKHYRRFEDAFRDAQRDAMGCDAYYSQADGVTVFFRDLGTSPARFSRQGMYPDPDGRGYHLSDVEIHEGQVPEYALTLYARSQ